MKQAVVLIHGIGEQKPMDTLRTFVSAVLPPAKDGKEQYFSKPDPMSELFELRRLQAIDHTATHFYEYYWAYHVQGTRLSHFVKWFFDLVRRKRCDIPVALQGIWFTLRILTFLIIAGSVLGVTADLQQWFTQLPYADRIWKGVILVLGVVQGVLIYYAGDAARYLTPNPENIALRQKIRQEGLELLKKLHESGEYDRIVIVGHSLGSVIGYDLIARLWIEYSNQSKFKKNADRIADCYRQKKSPQPFIGRKLYDSGSQLDAKKRCSSLRALSVFRKAQVAGWHEQRSFDNPWKISDFITLGSPLAHAMLLLANTGEEFEERKRQRELPTCPPEKDGKGYAYTFKEGTISVNSGKLFTPLILHHAAPFAVTRWTNLYFPAHKGLFGDLIGGPLREVFGSGIRDVPLKATSWKRFTPLSHTRYWDRSAEFSPAVHALKRNLALSTLWKFQK